MIHLLRENGQYCTVLDPPPPPPASNVDENCKYKTHERVFENAREYSRHFATPPLVSQGNKV